ncbi:MAG: hypothetical protein GY719_21380 [bacterium]|nr:hypothetical protein [bacterium]
MLKLTLKTRRTPEPLVWNKGLPRRSKLVTDRIDDAETLRGSIDAKRGETAARLGAKLAPVLAAGEEQPNFELTLELVVRTVEVALERLQDADRRYRRAATSRHNLRQEVVRLARRELNPGMRDVRKTAEALYGKELGQALHRLRGKTLRKPWRVRSQAREMINALEDGRSGPAQADPSLAAHLDEWLGLVKQPYDKLVAAMRDLEVRQHDQDREYILRQEAIEHFDGVYREALDVIEAWYRFAGRSDRPIRHLRSRARRRRLRREASAKRRQRLAGRGGQIRKSVRAAARSVAGWRPWRRSAG